MATLIFSDYNGFAQAVEQTAERAYAQLPAAAQAALPRLVRALSEPGPSGIPVPRAAPVAEAAPDEASAALASVLVDARVLTRDGETLRFVHEASLRGWRRAARAAKAAETFLRVREDVARAQARWEAAGRPRSLLLPSGVALAEAEAMLAVHGEEVGALRDFIGRSRRRARLGQSALAAATASFALVAILALLSYGQARQSAVLAAMEQLQGEENAAAAEAAAAVAVAEADLLRAFRASEPGTTTPQTVALAFAEPGKLDPGVEAVASLDEALAHFRTLADGDGDSSRWARRIAELLARVGDSRWLVGDGVGALAAHGEMLAVLRPVADRDPANRDTAIAVVAALTKVAQAADGAARRSALEEALERVLELEAHNGLDADQAEWPRTIRAALAETIEP